MRVYYKPETGAITFTATVLEGARPPVGTFIEVPEQELDLFAMRVENGQLVEKTEVSVAQKERALEAIREIRTQSRLLFVSDIPGQSAVYVAKNEEAIQLLTAYSFDDEIPLSDFPLIASEVGVTAATAWDVAQVFANLNLLWRHAAGAVDGACFRAEAAVNQATTPGAVEAVVSTLRNQINAALGG